MLLKKRLLAGSLAIFLVGSACNMSLFSAPTPGPEAVKTSAALTVEALRTEIAKNAVGTVTMAASPGTPGGVTLAPTRTNTPPNTAIPPTAVAPTITPTPLPCDKAEFASETIPDGTTYGPNVNFTKTWRLKNVGTCSWTPSYKLVFFSGDSMSGAAAIPLAGNVNPGAIVDLSVPLKSPAATGSYKGYWKLQNASGVNFGLGATADKAFWVQITVGATAVPPPPAFAVTGVSTTVDAGVGACPTKTYTFTANITANGPGTVTYKWLRSDSSSAPTETLVFAAAGTQTVVTTWALGGVYTGWQKIYIDNPNHQEFGAANFSVNCP